jgi:hypothetical protein
MSKEEAVAQVQDEDDDEPDEWYIVVELPNQDPSSTNATADRDKRIFSTGCAGEFTSIKPGNQTFVS